MQAVSSSDAFKYNHFPVMGKKVIEQLQEIPPELLQKGLIIDATLGGGGHSELILQNFPETQIIGLDQDPAAREASLIRLNKFDLRINIVPTNFADFETNKKVVCVLADLGVSSPQLDNASRGFSFRLDGPLDMRMNPTQGTSAEELINNLNEEDLANTIYKYGEEKFSRRIAKRIKKDIQTKGNYSGTAALAYAIAGCFPPKARYGRIHPATRTFQALRIAVNKEIDSLNILLEKAPDWIIKDGLFMMISFHSLEDRNIKHAFANDERLKKVNKKPIIADLEELNINPRSRSAKLRVAQRL